MKRKPYEAEMRRLHGELVALQEWVKATGAKICIVFEGRDTAGKGGTIKRITERVSPRVFRVVALPAPSERERSQLYAQRYIRHFPSAGEVVIFDRSWYNRAGVEWVMGFCTPEETARFLEGAPLIERTMADSGILPLKYWLEVDADEQTRRLEARIDDPRKVWKLSDMDLKSYSRWYDYSRARDAMLQATDTAWAPWYIADTSDKKRGRLNIISHLLEPDSLRVRWTIPARSSFRRGRAGRLCRTQSAAAMDSGTVLSPAPQRSRPGHGSLSRCLRQQPRSLVVVVGGARQRQRDWSSPCWERSWWSAPAGRPCRGEAPAARSRSWSRPAGWPCCWRRSGSRMSVWWR